MALLLLLALQAVVTFGGLLFVWRRLDGISAEIADLRQQLLAARAEPQRRRRAGATVVPLGAAEARPAEDAHAPSALSRAMRSWRPHSPTREDRRSIFDVATLSPETLRAITLFVLAAAPSMGFFLRAEPSAIVASGITIAAAMMLIGLRPLWRAAAWASVIAGAAWATIGFVLGAEHVSFATCIALAAAAGLTHAHLRRAAPGAALTLLMAAAALGLGAQAGMVGPAGIAFGSIVAMAAAVGAMTLRLEAIHLAAFGAALIGLFVASGQDSAAIWFTPAVTWMGAWFFAIAVIRVPQLGAQGAAIAATGALAPLLAAGALHLSEHGLANAYAAAAAFFVVALSLAGLIAVAALRDQRGIAALKLSVWILALAAFVAAASAICIAAPPAVAAPTFAALALGLIAIDARASDAVWRTFAIAAGLMAALSAWLCVRQVGSEAPDWSPWALIPLGLALPAAISAGAAHMANRNKATLTAGVFETITLAVTVVAIDLLIRIAMSGGAMLLHPVGFVEAGLHASVWLAASLYLGVRIDRGATTARRVAAAMLGAIGLATMLVCGLLWFSPLWTARGGGAVPFLTHHGIGFALPAILCWLHWLLWRTRGAELPARLALGAGALLSASFVTLEIVEVRADAWLQGADWLSVLAGATAFALAIGINFAPGVVNANAPRQLDFEEYLKRDRRSQHRREARQ